jgi:HK97 family phage portal protein
VAVDLIAQRIASQIPNVGHIQQTNVDPSKRLLLPYHREKALTPLFGQDDLERADHNHPLVRLFHSPNDTDTSYDLFYETLLFLGLTGCAYWWVAKNPVTKLPVAIWVLPSHWVFPVFDRDGVVEAYDLRPAEGNYLRRQYPADEIIFFRFKNPFSKVDGYSTQTAVAQWVDTAHAIDRHRWYIHKNGAFPAAALEFSGDYSDPTDDDLQRIEAKFLSRYAGEVRAGKPLLLPPGVKFHKLDIQPKQLAFGESSDQIRDNILSAYHVPAAVAGIIKDINGQTLWAASTLFYGNVVNPRCRMLGMTATEYFRKVYSDESLRVWYDDHTPDDPEMLEKRIASDLAAMAITPEEVRLLRGRRPYPFGGQDPVMPHVGLSLPWVSGKDVNAINPFTHALSGPPKAGKPNSDKSSKDDESSKDESSEA